MSQAVRFQEVLRKLAIIDERCVEDQAGLSLALPTSGLLDPRTAALVQVGALVAIGAPAVCLEWGTTRALAAGATAEEITGVLLAVGPAAGLGRVAGAVSGVAAALEYDVETALLEYPDGP
jgi:alkylhydroperoxidase/carboxymuconolactone decarboxylase family protein YurZ